MAWFHVTIGTVISAVPVVFNTELETATLTSVGCSALRQSFAPDAVRVRFGLTAPGDENVQIYTLLGSGLLSPSDGLLWSGSIRLRSPVFLCLQYTSDAQLFLLFTWSTTG